MAMVEGIAQGGPRHNIKITADVNWDGIINKPVGPAGKRVTHNGWYSWHYVSATWFWQVGRRHAQL